MNELILPGLRASEPIGFLAALGTLRLVAGIKALGDVRLGWSDQSGWPARLTSDKAIDSGRLIDSLLNHMRGRHRAPMFSGCVTPGQEPWQDVKVPTAEFAELLRRVRVEASLDCREPADLFTALGSELTTISNRDVVKPSGLHMTSGQQAFLSTLRELASSLDPDEQLPRWAAGPPDMAFLEAVFAEPNGWRAADAFSAMGLDPNREAVYALSASAPTDVGARCTRAGVWLAVEAVPFFPCLPYHQRLRTRGYDRRTMQFRWPIWDSELSTDGVRTVLGIDLNDDENLDRARQFGIRAVMQSDRITIGQGYGQFRPAVRVT